MTTVAPTGTLAMIADCSSGIEPLFAVSFVKRVLDGRELVYVHAAFIRMAREGGFYSEELMQTVARMGGVQELAAVPAIVAFPIVRGSEAYLSWVREETG